MKIDDLLNEEEYDYYRDYKNGLISHEEYQQLVKQFQQREKERGWEKRAHDRGPWYIEIDGKIYKQKGVPKSFDWESGARKYALAIMKNRPDLHGKIALTKHLPNDTHQGVAEGDDRTVANIKNYERELAKYKKFNANGAHDVKIKNLEKIIANLKSKQGVAEGDPETHTRGDPHPDEEFYFPVKDQWPEKLGPMGKPKSRSDVDVKDGKRKK